MGFSLSVLHEFCLFMVHKTIGEKLLFINKKSINVRNKSISLPPTPRAHTHFLFYTGRSLKKQWKVENNKSSRAIASPSLRHTPGSSGVQALATIDSLPAPQAGQPPSCYLRDTLSSVHGWDVPLLDLKPCQTSAK